MLSLTILIITLTSVTALHMPCDFLNLHFKSTQVFSCSVDKPFEILNSNRIITDATDPQKTSKKSYTDVQGLEFKNKKVHHFPKGIDKIFTRINFIRVIKCGLTEIHQSDLAPFVHLEFINLEHNELTTIESDLFKSNHNLQMIWLSHNKIDEIDGNVFDNLKNLKELDLNSNKCLMIAPNRKNVTLAIEAVRKSCSNCPKRLAEVESEKIKLKEEIIKIKLEKEKCASDSLKLRDEIKKLHNEIEKIKNEKEKMKDANVKLNNESEKLNGESEKCQKDLRNVENVNKEFDDEVKGLKTVNGELKVENERLSSQLQSLKSQITSLNHHKSESQNHQTENKILHDKITQLSSEIDKLKAENSNLHTNKENVLKGLKNDLDNFRKNGENLIKINKKLSDENSKLKDERDNLMNVHDEVKSLKDEMENFLTKISKLNEKNVNCEDQLKKSIDANEKLNDDLQKFNKSSINLEEKLQKDHKVLNDELKLLKDSIHNCTLKNDELIINKSSALTQASDKINQLEHERTEKNFKLQKCVDEVNKLSASESRLNKCEVDLEESKGHQEVLRKNLKDLQDQEEFEHEEIKDELKKSDTKIENLTKTNENLSAQLQNCIEASTHDYDDDLISSFIKDSPHDKFLIAFGIIVSLAVVNLIMMVFCCCRSRKYDKSFRISSADDFSEDFEFSKVPVKYDANIYQSIKEVKGDECA